LDRPVFRGRIAAIAETEATMKIRAAIILLACAMLQPSIAAPRPFSIAEEAIIERNEALRSAYQTDPALVRRVLDAMKSRGQSKDKQRDVFGPGAPGAPGRDAPAPPGEDIDPAANPDLAIFQRGSPEAAHDLFQLLKKAAGRK
jgi:hypothetical protein